MLPADGSVSLESILFTEELKRRPSRSPDYETENRALTALVQALANSPGTILQTLADTILEVFQAGSAGLSLLTKDGQRFYWPAIAGGWKPHVGGGTPREFGPCGDVLDCDGPLLFKRWDLRYPYLQAATPLAEEGLLIPFYVGGKAVGTIWAISHDDDRIFDSEDLRLLESLGRFASAAYQAVELQKAREAELAALRLMENAVQSGHLAETHNVKLREEITERKRAEVKLRESEERFRTLFDLSSVAVYSIDASGVIQNFNLRAAELWGQSPAVGDTDQLFCGAYKLYRPDGTFMPHDRCPMATVASGEIAEARDAEVLIERADGSRITVIVNIRPLKNDRGEITGAINCFYDITERKQAETALRESEEFNRSIIESSPDCIKVLDLQGTLLSMQSGQELLGISDIRPFLNKSWIELWDRADQPAVRTAVQGAAAGEDTNFVAFFRTFDGRPKWWDVTITPILDAQGRPARLLAISRDVTRRHEQAEALRESEARFRTLFNGVPIAIYSTDAAGTVQEFNPVAVALWGREPQRGDPAEKYCASYRIYLPDGSYLPHDQTPVVAVLSGQVPAVRDAEVIIERPDGSRITISANIVPLKNDAGEITGVMNCFYDITDRKRGEIALREAQTQLTDRAGHLEWLVTERTAETTATSKQLETFVYSIAHDLRAPLRSMQGFSRMLMEDAGTTLSETGRDFADRINKSAQFMDALLLDLLAFSRVAQEQIKLTPVHLETVVQSVLSRLEKEIQEKNGCLKGTGPWPSVLGHEPALGQVIFNLVSNALKFVRPDVPPCIRVYAEEQGRFVRVWVEDNGIGIAPDHQAQIFGLFTRLHGSNFPGTGIGLAIVEKSVERMGGNAGVESTPGEGSRFWFNVPKAGQN